MSKFTEMWRVTHGEPLTYNERIINSACDIIERQDEQMEEEYNRGVKDGLNQAAEIVKKC